MKQDVIVDGKRHSAEFTRGPEAPSHIAAKIDDREVVCDGIAISPGLYSILIGGRSLEVSVAASPAGLRVRAGNREFQLEIRDRRAWRRGGPGGIEIEGRQQIAAPMSGKVIRALVAQGEAVEAGQGILVVEAMKMQNEIRSPKSGKVEQLLVQEGQTVNSGQILAVII